MVVVEEMTKQGILGEKTYYKLGPMEDGTQRIYIPMETWALECDELAVNTVNNGHHPGMIIQLTRAGAYVGMMLSETLPILYGKKGIKSQNPLPYCSVQCIRVGNDRVMNAYDIERAALLMQGREYVYRLYEGIFVKEALERQEKFSEIALVDENFDHGLSLVYTKNAILQLHENFFGAEDDYKQPDIHIMVTHRKIGAEKTGERPCASATEFGKEWLIYEHEAANDLTPEEMRILRPRRHDLIHNSNVLKELSRIS
ncbi:MAG: hypothetical protein V1870_05855 [Candidatus Aenigmatarchaeota archaeon]